MLVRSDKKLQEKAVIKEMLKSIRCELDRVSSSASASARATAGMFALHSQQSATNSEWQQLIGEVKTINQLQMILKRTFSEVIQEDAVIAAVYGAVSVLAEQQAASAQIWADMKKTE